VTRLLDQLEAGAELLRDVRAEFEVDDAALPRQ
jgi:hypothetical protein